MTQKDNYIPATYNSFTTLTGFSLFLFFLLAAYVAFYSSSLVLFIEHFTAAELPSILITTGLASVVGGGFINYVYNNVSFYKFCLFVTFSFSVLTFTFFYGSFSEYKRYFLLFSFLLQIQIPYLITLLTEKISLSFFQDSEFKKSYKFLEIYIPGIILLISVFFILITQYNLVRLVDLLFISGVFSFLAFFTAIFVFDYKAYLKEVESNVQYIRDKYRIKEIWKNKYMILLVFFTLVSFIFISLPQTLFIVVNDLSDKDSIAFYRTYTIIISIVAAGSFVARKFLLDKLLNAYGQKTVLLFLPVIISLFSIILFVISVNTSNDAGSSIFFLFGMLAIIIKVFADTVFTGLNSPLIAQFLLPIDEKLRNDLDLKIKLAVSGIALAIVGLSLYECLDSGIFSFKLFSVIILLSSLLVTITSVFLHKFYIVKLHTLLNDKAVAGTQNKKTTNWPDKLTSYILNENNTNPIYSLYILNIIHPVRFREVILSFIKSEDNDLQRTALNFVRDHCVLGAIPLLTELIDSKYFPVLKNGPLIKEVNERLLAANFRLEKKKYIEQLTLSKLTNERRYGALLVGYADQNIRGELLVKLLKDPDDEVKRNAIMASEGFMNKDVQNILIERLAFVHFANACVASLTVTGDFAIPLLESAFYLTGQEEIVQKRIIQIYGWMGTNAAMEVLVNKINHRNQNISSYAIDCLSKTGYQMPKEKVLYIKKEIEDTVKLLLWNSKALQGLHRTNSANVIIEALDSEVTNNYKTIFKLLTLLFDPETVKLAEENIFSQEDESRKFAFALLQFMLPDELKVYLNPVFDESSREDKIIKLEESFPLRVFNTREILIDLIQRDTKSANKWTKASAMYVLGLEKNSIDAELFTAHLVNPEPLLRESAAIALLNLDHTLFEDCYSRLLPVFKEKRYEDFLLGKFTLEKTLEENKFETIRFLSRIEELKNIPGLLLIEIEKLLDDQNLITGQEIELVSSSRFSHYYIVKHGKVMVIAGDTIVKDYSSAELINPWFYHQSDIVLKTEADALLYRIDKDKLEELISITDEISFQISRNNYSFEQVNSLV